MKVLFLDDDQNRWDCFKRDNLDHGCRWAISAKDAIEALVLDEYSYISLDHDLCVNDQNKRSGFNVATGLEVAQFLADKPGVSPHALIVLHTYNDWGAKRMAGALNDAGRDCVIAPFNSQDAFIGGIFATARRRKPSQAAHELQDEQSEDGQPKQTTENGALGGQGQ